METRKIIIYAAIVIFCIFSLAVGIYFQYFYKYSETDKFLLGKIDTNAVSEETYTNLKNSFESIFNNNVSIVNNVGQYSKIDPNKNIVYTNKDTEQKEKKYSINANLPFVNIDSSGAEKINEEIELLFGSKAKTIKTAQDMYSIYNVSYTACAIENILSVVVKAILKEGDNPQRIIIKTYCYDIANDKILDLEDIIEISSINKSNIQSKINKEIRDIEKRVNQQQEAGYSVFKRDSQSEIYKIENSKNFFISKEGYLYIIYSYGNSAYTSEIDLVII